MADSDLASTATPASPALDPQDALERRDPPPRVQFRDPVLAAIVLVGAGLRFATLATQSLWADEGFTAKIAGHGLASAIAQVPKTESTPPLYYALAWIWAHLFGSSAYALRSLSALFGSLTVAAVYWMAVGFTSRRMALAAASLTAVAPIMVWYSQEARAYALLVLLCVLALGCFWRALREHRGAWIIGWAICSVAGLATHYFAIFPLAVEAVWLVVASGRRRDLLAAVALPVVVGAALIPLVLYQRAHVPRPWTSIFTVSDQVKATTQAFLVGISWTPIIHRLGVALLAVLVVASLVALARSGTRQERGAGLQLALLFVAMVGVPVVVSAIGTNYLAPRNVLYAWPTLAALVALGAARRAAGRLSAAALIAGCSVCLAIVVAVAATPRLQRDDWRDLLRPLRASGIARAVVLLDGFDNTPVLEYYLPALRASSVPTAVREIDVVTTKQQVPAAQRALPVAGLTPAGTVIRGNIAVSRFTAAGVVTVPAAPPPGSGEAYLVGSP